MQLFREFNNDDDYHRGAEIKDTVSVHDALWTTRIPVAGGSAVQVRADDEEDDEDAAAYVRRDDRARRGGDFSGN